MTNAVNDSAEPKFSQEQYEILMRCSEARSTNEWITWRKKHPKDEIALDGAKLEEAHLDHIDLETAHLRGAKLKGASMRHARLMGADLSGASLYDTQLDGAMLWEVDLRGADLREAHLGALMTLADLREANLWSAHLEKGILSLAKLQGADFSHAIVSGETNIDACEIDDSTNFTAVGLRSARIEPSLRSRLEGNVRRLMWQKRYNRHEKSNWLLKLAWRLLHFPVRLFWWASDYGQSTSRVLLSFLLLALVFAVAYGTMPGLVANLHHVDGELVPSRVVPFRAAYFSIVTMTTLGFGDMYADPGGILGHVLLSLQVLLGYVLLGALVTRLSVLFQES